MIDPERVDLQGRVIAILGGDEREQEIARLAATTGAEVRGYGFPWPEGGIAGVVVADSPASAMDGADYALFPIPLAAPDGTLFAPASPGKILPDEALLRRMRPGASIVLGAADAKLRAAALSTGVSLHEYEDDRELMLLRGPAIVEGALRVAIENTRVTIHASKIGVVGHGTIGALLARTLVAVGGEVHVFARNPQQRAAAYAAGCHPHRLEDLAAEVGGLAMLFSTVPAPVVPAAILERMAGDALVVDMAAPPGGVDFEAAKRRGLRAVWARGLGRRAPVTVGRSQWYGISRRIAEIERTRTIGGGR